jgi:hypothetical protein
LKRRQACLREGCARHRRAGEHPPSGGPVLDAESEYRAALLNMSLAPRLAAGYAVPGEGARHGKGSSFRSRGPARAVEEGKPGTGVQCAARRRGVFFDP